jgi:ABC-type phosphate transport system substrate-binding protein
MAQADSRAEDRWMISLQTQETSKMKKQKITLLVVAPLMLALMATACNKTDSSANAGANSSPGKNSSSSPATPSTSGTSSTASNRFVGTWVEEGEKNDKGTRFTEDGKIIEVSSEKSVGTYTVTGNDKATINVAEGGRPGTATLESDNRMRMEGIGETAYLIRK